MSAIGILEDDVEVGSVIPRFREMGYSFVHGPDIAPDGNAPERRSYEEVVLAGRLEDALARINAGVPRPAIAEAMRQVLDVPTARMLDDNLRFHRMLVSGIDVEWAGPEGPQFGNVMLVDFDDVEANDWLCVNQFTVKDGQVVRRPDVIVFVNGLPLAVIELKNPGAEQVPLRQAFDQLETYKRQIPALFAYNGLLVVSNEFEARLGSLTAGWDRFMAWRTIDGEQVAGKGDLELETLQYGVFARHRFLDLIRYCTAFEVDGENVIKMMGQYHQYWAAKKAVETTIAAARVGGDRRAGVVWHTQGSGKSLSMLFYAGRIAQSADLGNPTIVVLTDRNDLDEQLYGQFARCSDLLRQTPVQATSREHLQELLAREHGGVIFTTIQKFAPAPGETEYPQLSTRRNIVFIADEAHRSQYDMIDGFAKHMRDALPGATFIGFTGTPIEASDKSTPAVFGDYIDIYDIHRAVEDGSTVPIYYEARLARLGLDEAAAAQLDERFDEVTEGEEDAGREKLKTKWAALETIVGSPERIAAVAADLVAHWELRRVANVGKAMVVCMSRRICVDLYAEIRRLRPEWHADHDGAGRMKVVMTGSATDPESYAPHVRNKAGQSAIARRVRDPQDELEVVFVRDMWLTGFDAPCLHTMYVDKPMQGHGLMQAIARVNRRFRDKPGGLVVDYIGIGEPLKKALANYSASDKGSTGVPVDQAIRAMREQYEIAAAILHGVDLTKVDDLPKGEWGRLALAAYQRVLEAEDGQRRFTKAITSLLKAFALCSASDEARALSQRVGFLQLVKARLGALTVDGEKRASAIDAAIRQIVSDAIVSEGVVDILAEAGVVKANIGILSDEFLDELSRLPQKNLALETLRKILADEIRVRQRTNLVQARSFRKMLEDSINRYRNRSLEAAEVLQALIEMAKELQQQDARLGELGLDADQLAFYDALAAHGDVQSVMGDEVLADIARELVETVRTNATIDWTLKDSVRAKMRVAVKRLLRKFGYPPDEQERATDTVIEQAERWAEGVAA